MPVLEYCSAGPYSAADTHLIGSGARFVNGDVFECDIALRRSMALLCMMY